MKVLGLTGGIGSGKSTVSEFFRELGATLVNADQITHRIYDLHPEIIPLLFEKFGNEIGDLEKGTIDRRRLGEIVFSDSEKRKELETLLHPLIRAEIQKKIDQARKNGAPLVIVDAPLLVETGYYKAFEGLIVVKADVEQQIQRILGRDSLTYDEISQRIASQMPLDEKLKIADWIIDNSGDLAHTKAQVKALYSKIVP